MRRDRRAMTGGPAFAWEPEKGSHVGVMRRDGDVSSIRWFNTEACYVFHPLNSWEERDRIFCDVMRYDTAPLFPRADGSPGTPPKTRSKRFLPRRCCVRTFTGAGNETP